MKTQTRSALRGEQVTRGRVRHSVEEPIRVVVIDDNRLLCDRLATVLGECAPFEVVATADSVSLGLAHVRERKPDVALVDASFCQGDTAHCCARVREMAPEAQVVMMDVTPSGADLVMMIKAGAKGFVLRDATVDDLVGTIRTVAEGTAVLPEALTPVLWSSLSARPGGRGASPSAPAAVFLTLRERQIALLIGEGYANKEIAQQLHIATHTVKSHIHHILKKLELHTRLQLAASQAGWTRGTTGSPNMAESRIMMTSPGPSAARPADRPAAAS